MAILYMPRSKEMVNLIVQIFYKVLITIQDHQSNPYNLDG